MQNFNPILLITTSTFVVLLALILNRQKKQIPKTKKEHYQRELPPDLLHRGKPKGVYSEQDLRYVSRKVMLNGRVDQVYLNTKNCLVVVDNKTRANSTIYHSDRVQVSVYAYILSKTVKAKVAKYAYIRTSQTGKKEGRTVEKNVCYHRVEILNSKEIERLYRLANDVYYGKNNICTCKNKLHFYHFYSN